MRLVLLEGSMQLLGCSWLHGIPLRSQCGPPARPLDIHRFKRKGPACTIKYTASLTPFEVSRRSLLLPVVASTFQQLSGVDWGGLQLGNVAQAAEMAQSSDLHALVTGGNSGIGKAAATELARRGLTVTLACRSLERGAEAAEEIVSATGNDRVRVTALDLASLQSVRDCAASYVQSEQPLHILVNNAGVMAAPFMLTEDGFEYQFGVNHLGHFELTRLLMGTLACSGSPSHMSRVVVVSSEAHRLGALDFEDLQFLDKRRYGRWESYGQSKLANILFARELSRRCSAAAVPVTVNSLHPGVVDTQLIRYLLPPRILEARAGASEASAAFARLLGLKTPEEGAETVVYLSLSQEMEGVTGRYYDNCQEKVPSAAARDDELAAKLWLVSEDLVGTLTLESPKLSPSAKCAVFTL